MIGAIILFACIWFLLSAIGDAVKAHEPEKESSCPPHKWEMVNDKLVCTECGPFKKRSNEAE